MHYIATKILIRKKKISILISHLKKKIIIQQLSSVGYHMSVTRLPTAKDYAEEESGSCYLCPESVRRILSTMLDISLLKKPSFLILAISGGLTMTGFYTPFVFVPSKYFSKIQEITVYTS